MRASFVSLQQAALDADPGERDGALGCLCQAMRRGLHFLHAAF
jgi:hypothetical protein